MPSNKPRIATYTTTENIEKMKEVAAANQMSMSKYLNYLIEKNIQEYEKKYGNILSNNSEKKNAIK